MYHQHKRQRHQQLGDHHARPSRVRLPGRSSNIFLHISSSTDNLTRAATSRSTLLSPKTTPSSHQVSASKPRSTTRTCQMTTAAPCAWACCVLTSGSRRTRSRMCLRWSGQSSRLPSRMTQSRLVLRTSSRTTGPPLTRARKTGSRGTPRVRKRARRSMIAGF